MKCFDAITSDCEPVGAEYHFLGAEKRKGLILINYMALQHLLNVKVFFSSIMIPSGIIGTKQEMISVLTRKYRAHEWRYIFQGHSEVYLPKTFTTRKGALLLFSEDFANKQRQSYSDDQHEESEGPELHTVADLAKSILAYGASKVSVCIECTGMHSSFIFCWFIDVCYAC